jgi:hypothetical protein
VALAQTLWLFWAAWQVLLLLSCHLLLVLVLLLLLLVLVVVVHLVVLAVEALKGRGKPLLPGLLVTPRQLC